MLAVLLAGALTASCAAVGGEPAAGGTASATPSAGPGSTVDGEGDTHQEFLSRPDLRPPAVEALVEGRGEDVVLLAPGDDDAAEGGLIVDARGETVWAAPGNRTVTDLRVQRYRDQPVLTWWEAGTGAADTGRFVVVDSRYQQLATIDTDDTDATLDTGDSADGDVAGEHQLRLTSADTALLLVHRVEPADLRAAGGPADGYARNAYVQEVDVATGELLLEWSAADHVAFTDAGLDVGVDDVEGAGGSADAPVDWLHVSSVTEGGPDTLLVAARNAHAVYALDRATGELRWTLGGASSDFTVADDAALVAPQDARLGPDGTLTVVDGGAPADGVASRVVTLALDEHAGTAALVRETVHPTGAASGLVDEQPAQVQLRGDGSTVLGWSHAGRVSELDRSGDVVMDLAVTPAATTAGGYRGYRAAWHAEPAEPPVAVAGEAGVAVSWNGATEVAGWRLVADGLPVGAVQPRQGFETVLAVPSDLGGADVQAEALTADGQVLATTEPVSAP